MSTTIPSVDLANSENDICPISVLLHGTQALVIIFCPYTFGESVEGSIENLIVRISKIIEIFQQNDIRVISVTRESPCTNRHWAIERNFNIEVFSDATLELSKALVGTFDLSQYFLATKGILMGSFHTCMPGVVIVNGDGKIMHTHIASSPEMADITVDTILMNCGVSGQDD